MITTVHPIFRVHSLFVLTAALSFTQCSDSGFDGATGGDGSNDGGGNGGDGGEQPWNYDSNLQKILDSTFRNTNEDDSPYRDTPSEELFDKADLYDDYTVYYDPATGASQGYEGVYGGEYFYEPTYFPGNGAGTFRASCEVSHFAYDDPAVLPGQPEASHMQMFIGNTYANAYSTYDSLMNEGGGTCNGRELNRTAYWVPAMFDGEGNVVVPSLIKFYYKTEMATGIGEVQTYPENLQLIADRRNNLEGLETFRCNTVFNGNRHSGSNTIPSCVSEDPYGALEMMIYFDHCWNGVEDTIGDWSKNSVENFVRPMHYWHSSVCPESHPILLPAIATHIFFDIKPGEDTANWFLASDVDPTTGTLKGEPGASAYAGWFGAWNKESNQEFVDNCNNRLGECGSGLLGDPARDGPVRAFKRRTDWATGVHRIPVRDVYEQMCSVSAERSYNGSNGGAASAYCRPTN